MSKKEKETKNVDIIDDVEEITEEEENKASNELWTKIKKKFSKDVVVSLLIGILIGVIIGYVIFTVALRSAINDMSNTIQTNMQTMSTSQNTSEETIDTYASEHRDITDSAEINEIKGILSGSLQEILNGPTYAQITMSDQISYAYLFNTKGEFFMEDNNFSDADVSLNNGKSYVLNPNTGSLVSGEDSNAIQLLLNTVNAVDGTNIKLYEMTLYNTDVDPVVLDTKHREFRIDLIGDDAIKSMYSTNSESFKSDMITNLHAKIEQTVPNWEPHIIVRVQIDTETNKIVYAASCFVVSGQEYFDFQLIGYDNTIDWEMPKEWYNYNPENDTTGEEFYKLFTDTTSVVDNVLMTYASDNGFDIGGEDTDNTEDEENTENTEVETTEEEKSSDN